MNINGAVREQVTGFPMDNVSIEVLNQSGDIVGGGSSNKNGGFAFNVGNLDRLRFSHVGYTTTTLPASYFIAGDKEVYLVQSFSGLDEVVVTAKAGKKTNMLIFLIGGLIVGRALKLF